MSRHTIVKMAAAALLGGLLAPPAAAQSVSQSLETPSDCVAIGGQWANVGWAGIIGICRLSRYYEVPANTRLEIGTQIYLHVLSGATLVNRGEILILDHAAMHVAGGRLDNPGRVVMANDAEFRYDSGQLLNTGAFDVEGDIWVSPNSSGPGGAQACWDNVGDVNLFSGGNLFNRGCVESRNRGKVDVYDTGKLYNLNGGRFVARWVARLDGQFRQQPAGVAEVGPLRIGAGALILNFGDLTLSGTRLQVPGSARIELGPGASLTLATGEFRLDGTLTLDDATMDGNDLAVDVGTNGKISLTNGSEAWGASIGVDVNNQGTIRLDCYSGWHITGNYTGKPLLPEPCRRGPIVFPPPTL